MKPYIDHQTKYWNKKSSISLQNYLITEEPLSIFIEGRLYSAGMRTPGDELPLAAGLCLSKKIVDTADDFESLKFSINNNKSIVNITLKQSRKERVCNLYEKKELIDSPDSILISGSSIKELCKTVEPFNDATKISLKDALCCIENLDEYQPLRSKTGASHAACLYSENLELLSAAEDVGRHNAVDKVIGKLLLDGKLQRASIAVLSSRVSAELVWKIARARIPVILAVSRPTSLAVELALHLDMTVSCLAKGSGLYVFCGADRLTACS